MMGRVVPFEAWHALDVVSNNGGVEDMPPPLAFEESTANLIELDGGSFTFLVDNDILACGGTLEQWPGRYQAWIFLAPGSEKHMLEITRRLLTAINELAGRIEMTVIHDFEQGHRWAKMLGFRVETPLMKAYGPAGEDHVGYVRIN